MDIFEDFTEKKLQQQQTLEIVDDFACEENKLRNLRGFRIFCMFLHVSSFFLFFIFLQCSSFFFFFIFLYFLFFPHFSSFLFIFSFFLSVSSFFFFYFFSFHNFPFFSFFFVFSFPTLMTEKKLSKSSYCKNDDFPL